MSQEIEPEQAAKDGQDVERFLKSDLWLRVIEPRLAREQEQADVKRSYQPGTIPVGEGEPEQYRSFYSGVFATLERVVKILRHVIEDGDEAQKELERRSKKSTGDRK